MRRVAGVALLVALVVGGLPVVAAGQRRDASFDSVPDSELVVWLVSHKAGGALRRGVTMPAQVQEQTAGSFGQTSSSVGRTAGSVGRGPGELGTTSSSVGQTAGSAGQTAGSFGVAASDSAQVLAVARGADPLGSLERRDPRWWTWQRNLASEIGRVHVRYVDVADAELRDRLVVAQGTRDAPDVVMAWTWPPEWKASLERVYSVRIVGVAPRVAQTEGGAGEALALPEFAVMVEAPHTAAARAFAVRMTEMYACDECGWKRPEAAEPSAVAVRSFEAELGGAELGADADPEMARYERPRTAASVWGAPLGSERDGLQVDVLGAVANDRMALVDLRATVQGPALLGVAHAQVVLRRSDEGRWRVLELTPNLEDGQMQRAWRRLMGFAWTGGGGTGTEPLGVSVASPRDGDSRSASPELWWDNSGGATMQVVEWQRCDRGCTAPRLFFVPDAEMRLRTRVVAGFAAERGRYRWRVWSLRGKGEMVLSGWRGFEVVSE